MPAAAAAAAACRLLGIHLFCYSPTQWCHPTRATHYGSFYTPLRVIVVSKLSLIFVDAFNLMYILIPALLILVYFASLYAFFPEYSASSVTKDGPV